MWPCTCHLIILLCVWSAGLILKIFLALLPLLLAFMNKLAGMQSLAEIDYGVMVKYFIFQVSDGTV